MQELSHNNNAVYRIAMHLVLVTKYRRRVLIPKAISRCVQIVEATCERWGGRAIECDGDADHIHVLMEIPPRVRPSDLVNNLKTVTSRLLRKEFASIRSAYRKPVLWSPSYCIVSAGGASLDVLKSYVEKHGASEDGNAANPRLAPEGRQGRGLRREN